MYKDKNCTVVKKKPPNQDSVHYCNVQSPHLISYRTQLFVWPTTTISEANHLDNTRVTQISHTLLSSIYPQPMNAFHHCYAGQNKTTYLISRSSLWGLLSLSPLADRLWREAIPKRSLPLSYPSTCDYISLDKARVTISCNCNTCTSAFRQYKSF